MKLALEGRSYHGLRTGRTAFCRFLKTGVVISVFILRKVCAISLFVVFYFTIVQPYSFRLKTFGGCLYFDIHILEVILESDRAVGWAMVAFFDVLYGDGDSDEQSPALPLVIRARFEYTCLFIVYSSVPSFDLLNRASRSHRGVRRRFRVDVRKKALRSLALLRASRLPD